MISICRAGRFKYQGRDSMDVALIISILFLLFLVVVLTLPLKAEGVGVCDDCILKDDPKACENYKRLMGCPFKKPHPKEEGA